MFNWIINNDLFLTVKIVNTVHDEIILECPISMSQVVLKKLKECMEDASTLYCKIIPLKADPVITKVWKH
jgi:DNA polymerase I-like protein with 3'-5' exonuclease and polymerase domains